MRSGGYCRVGGEGPGAVRFDRQTAGLPVESGVTYMVCVWQVTHITFTFLYLWKGVGGGGSPDLTT